MSDLERRYRRLLACYPRDHRARHGEEMLAVLIAGAGDRSRPGWRESVNLLWAAVRLHLRRVVAADGGIDPREVLAIVSLLAPVVMLAGASTVLHEIGWWIKAGALAEMPWRQVPDAPVWAVWLIVAMCTLLGLRRLAAVAAWLGVAGFVLLAAGASGLWWWAGPTAGWSLLGAVAAVALTASPGPSRGRQLAGRWSVPIMAVAVLATMVVGTIGYHLPAMQEWGLTALVAGAVVACGPRSRVGRRAALILALPAMTFALTNVLVATAGPVAINGPTALLAIVYYCVPVLVLLALGALPRRPRRRPDQT